MTRYIAAALIASTAACGAGIATLGAEPTAIPSPTSSSDSPFVVTTTPDPVQHDQPAILTIRGRAFGGRHLSVASFQVEGLGGFSSGPGCATDPSHEPPLPDDLLETDVPYTWKEPGTYTVSIELVAHCRGDIPSHSMSAEITVK